MEAEAEPEVVLTRGRLSARDLHLQRPHLSKEELGNEEGQGLTALWDWPVG